MAVNFEFVKIEENQSIETGHRFNCTTDALQLYCRSCTFQTNFLVQLKQHSKGFTQNEATSLHKCDKCAFETHSSIIYLKHIYSDNTCNTYVKHSEEKGNTKITWFNCDLCQYKAKSETILKNHRYWKHRKNISWFQCEQCPYQSRRKHDLKRHKLAKHTDPDILDVNKKSVQYPTRDHPKSDTSPLKISWLYCENCSYKTIDKSAYKKHIVRKHTSSESVVWFDCPRCPYRAKVEENLRRHQKSQHGNPDSIQWHYCAQCSYKTKRKRCLRYHELAKHELRDKNNSLKTSLWFQCGYCSYKTVHKHMLSQHHVKKHASADGVSSLCCAQCSYKGKTKFDVKMHRMIKHVGVEPIGHIQCSLCSFRTKSSNYLREHTLRVHQMRVEISRRK